MKWMRLITVINLAGITIVLKAELASITIILVGIVH